MKDLQPSTPDILAEERCEIDENVSVTPDEGGPAPLRVYFDATGAQAPCGKIRSWSWNFGDGTTGSGKRVMHTYTRAGNYVARVTITDSKGYTNLVAIDYVINVTTAGPR